MKKVDKSSSAGTEVESSTNVQVEQVSQPIAKPNVSRRLSWEEYKAANPCKDYDQSEKFSDYDQRVVDWHNNLYKEWLLNGC